VLVINVIGATEKITITAKYAKSLTLNLLPGRFNIKSIKRRKNENPRTIINTAGMVKNTIKCRLPGALPFWKVSLKKFLEKINVRKQRRV